MLDCGEPGVEAVDGLRAPVLVPQHQARAVTLLLGRYVARLMKEFDRSDLGAVLLFDLFPYSN